MTGCIWSWCRVRMERVGNGWVTAPVPGTGACILKLRARCDGTVTDCPERKEPVLPQKE